jgi:hypothetical protein
VPLTTAIFGSLIERWWSDWESDSQMGFKSGARGWYVPLRFALPCIIGFVACRSHILWRMAKVYPHSMANGEGFRDFSKADAKRVCGWTDATRVCVIGSTFYGEWRRFIHILWRMEKALEKSKADAKRVCGWTDAKRVCGFGPYTFYGEWRRLG